MSVHPNLQLVQWNYNYFDL